jgi:hypothetical protein
MQEQTVKTGTTRTTTVGKYIQGSSSGIKRKSKEVAITTKKKKVIE